MEIFGTVPFAGFSAVQITGVVLLYILAFFLKGVFGYGAAAALVAGASLIIPPHHAVILAAVSNFLTQAQFIPDSLRHGDRRVALRLAVWIVPAAAVGVWIFSRTDATGLSLMIGGLILLLVLTEIFGLTRHIEPFIARNERVAGPATATTSGVIGGMIGAGAIVFLSIYIRMLCPEKTRFRATVLLIGSIFVVWRLAIFTVAGLIGMQVLIEALLLLPVSMAAGYLGAAAVRRIPGPLFFRLYQGLLLVAALLLVWRGLSGTG